MGSFFSCGMWVTVAAVAVINKASHDALKRKTKISPHTTYERRSHWRTWAADQLELSLMLTSNIERPPRTGEGDEPIGWAQ